MCKREEDGDDAAAEVVAAVVVACRHRGIESVLSLSFECRSQPLNARNLDESPIASLFQALSFEIF